MSREAGRCVRGDNSIRQKTMSLMTLKIGLSVTKLCVQLQLIISTPNGWLVEIRQTNPGGKAGGS